MRTVHTRANAEKPSGADFAIGQCRFEPGKPLALEELFAASDAVTIEYNSTREHALQTVVPFERLYNWPMVYILANDEEAYVGQTTSIAHRMEQHGANPEKSAFTAANVIYNEEFNASVITDYEHRLIGYMHGDGRYRLTNKNGGMTDTDYFSKSSYADMFEALWDDLRSHDLVEHTLHEIEESDIFKYSPYKGLTVDQQYALDEITTAIEASRSCEKPGFRPVVVEGMPGTGKTVLAVYLLKLLKDNPKYKGLNIRLVEPVTSLRVTLRNALKAVAGLSPDDIIAPADIIKPGYGYDANKDKSFDIVLVDEAHRLKRRVNLGTQFANYDKVNKTLGLSQEATQMDWFVDQVRLPVFFYDPLQAVGPSCLTPDNVSGAVGDALKNPITLTTQMRVKGGRGYLEYIADILCGHDPLPHTFDGYELVFHENIESFVGSFEDRLRQSELTRMVAGYAWKWVTKPGSRRPAGEEPPTADIVIGDVALRWNCTYENWVGKGLENPEVAHEVGCIHSVQGYDLSYAYVIIGRDIEMASNSHELVANRGNYFDINGKNTASQAELDAFLRNIYYVLLTRGVYGTHIYVADPALREHLSRFFPRQNTHWNSLQ